MTSATRKIYPPARYLRRILISRTAIELSLGDHGVCRTSPFRSGGRAEHRASCSHHRRETHESNPWNNVVVYSLHSSASEVRFVPESRTSRVPQEPLPPLPVGIGTRPLH